jgi:hypothetical protein
MQLHRFEIIVFSKKKKADKEVLAMTDKIGEFVNDMETAASQILARMKRDKELPDDIDIEVVE